ncbi:MAG TPA: hypothetical protein VFQ00_05500 [Terriglobales bacterium]|nr:hypothetical protein [Terriglobales bacterium]
MFVGVDLQNRVAERRLMTAAAEGNPILVLSAGGTVLRFRRCEPYVAPSALESFRYDDPMLRIGLSSSAPPTLISA